MNFTSRIFSVIILSFLPLFCFCQINEIESKPTEKESDLNVVFEMIDFHSYNYLLKSEKPAYLNVYINEFVNDSLVNSFDYLSTKDKFPEELYSIVFPRIEGEPMKFTIHALAKTDSILTIRLRMGKMALVKKLKIDKVKNSYSWKSAALRDKTNFKFELNQKIDLLYYASAVEENISGVNVNKSCNIPVILNNKDASKNSVESRKTIKHYFCLGIELVEKIK